MAGIARLIGTPEGVVPAQSRQTAQPIRGHPWRSGCHLLRRESLGNPLKPHNPACLCNPPIFSDCFTYRRPLSDAFMRR